MAVPAYLRDESKAEFITVATRLAAWALKWCKDERLFTRRERWIVTGDIWESAKGALKSVKKANARRDLSDPEEFAAREAHLKDALDSLTDLKVLLTIKYEMVLQGFAAIKSQPQPVPPQAGASDEGKQGEGQQPPPASKKRGGQKHLTQDDIDRIFEIFFELALKEEGLIKGIARSDAERHAKAINAD